MANGVDLAEFDRRFGKSAEKIYRKQIETQIKNGLLKKTGDRISLTDRGIDISNTVFVEFI
jgi:oxygen-independent coproporphyrinogen-3 oxidase